MPEVYLLIILITVLSYSILIIPIGLHSKGIRLNTPVNSQIIICAAPTMAPADNASNVPVKHKK